MGTSDQGLLQPFKAPVAVRNRVTGIENDLLQLLLLLKCVFILNCSFRGF
jgi:hypothetical protein